MADKLAGYRGDPKASPQPVEDGTGAPPAAPHEGEDAARKAALAPPAAAPLVTGDRTPMFVDRQRQALAERFKAERVAERKNLVPASHVPFIDGDDPAIPGALPVEGAEPEPVEPEPADSDAAAEAREREEAERIAATQAAAEERAASTKSYILKVDGNQFSVSREELLRYAEIDAADAEQFSEVSLQRLAQKQIAASNRLAEANAIKDQARRTQQQPEPTARPAPVPAPSRTPDRALVEAVEKIQLGDPEEAARALQAVFDAGVTHALRENNQAHAFGGVQAEYAASIDAFTTQHPHVISNPVLSSAHLALVAREIADDIHALGLVDDTQYSAIATNPKLAADVLTAARAEGRQVRGPNAIFEAAYDKLAVLAGQVAQTPAPVPAPTPRAPVSRIAEKRALLPPLARAGISQMGSVEQTPTPEDRIAVASAAIQKMRKARFQPTS